MDGKAKDVTTALRMGPVKLVMGLLASPEVSMEVVKAALEERFGRCDMVSKPYPFDVTNYYEPEMGAEITRYILSFERLIPPEDLRPIKLATNQMENVWRDEAGRRLANVDPGYIDFFKLVLASNKPSGKKLAAGDGVWLDLNLVYEKGRWQTMPWTFPDFSSGRYDDFLTKVRGAYKKQMRAMIEPIG